MKKLARFVVAKVLYWQIRRLRKKHSFKTIAVAGSLGKTSTKMAIANLLSNKYEVRYQNGNYNDLITVPLIFFNQPLKSLFNPLAWLKILISNELQIRNTYKPEVVVVELGTDGPGFMQEFVRFINGFDFGVLTAIAPEHMEYFKNIEAVAEEELKIGELSSQTILNKDMCDEKYAKDIDCLTYAINKEADYRLVGLSYDENGASFEVQSGGKKLISAEHEAIAEPLLYAVLAAVVLAVELGLTDDEILAGIKKIKPAPGRMQILDGVNDSKIIDDTYNASPEAVKAALQTLYRLRASQKIAILGNMNELGSFARGDHQEIGSYCDPKFLDLVVTIGPDANAYLAAAAKAKGCRVESFDNPYKAGEFVKSEVKKGALILAKGSQNKVFAEEAVKVLLANADDASKLVRQSNYWLKRKAKSFR